MEYILRDTPEFSITLEKDIFSLIDEYHTSHTGVYLYKDLEKVSYNEQRTNWFFTIIGLFTEVEKIYKDNAQLKLYLNTKTIRFYPKKNERVRIPFLVKHLNRKINE